MKRHFEPLHWMRWNIFYPVMHFFGLKTKDDWWNAYACMSKKILPYMKDFQKGKKSGHPCDIEGEDAAEKWQAIIDEIVFALENYDMEDDDCRIPNPKFNPEQKEWMYTTPSENHEGAYTLHFYEDYGETIVDWEAYRRKGVRVAKGFELMGKYWLNLWD
jgi:hypothetical protein